MHFSSTTYNEVEIYLVYLSSTIIKRFPMFEFTNIDVLISICFLVLPLFLGTIINIATKSKYVKFVDRFAMVSMAVSTYFCWPLGGFFLTMILFAKACISYVYCREFGVIGSEKWKRVAAETLSF